MSFGKMNSFIDIITTEPVRDAEGFVCAGGRYRIVSVENVRERGMYLEVLAEKIEPT